MGAHATLSHFFFFLFAIVLLVPFVVYPLFQTICISFFEDNTLTIKHYLEVMGSPESFNAILHNLIWIFVHLPLSIVLGLIFAVLLQDNRIKGVSIIKAIIFIGMVIPMVVGALIIRFSFEKGIGIVPLLFRNLGVITLDKTWTAYPDTALFSLIIGSIWLWTGFNMIVFSSGLAAIPKEYREAAIVDGASDIQTFFKIILPLLKPSFLVALLTTFLYELKIFDIVYVATKGGPGDASIVLAILVYIFAFRDYAIGKAAVAAVLLIAICLIPSIEIAKLVTKRV